MMTSLVLGGGRYPPELVPLAISTERRKTAHIFRTPFQSCGPCHLIQGSGLVVVSIPRAAATLDCPVVIGNRDLMETLNLFMQARDQMRGLWSEAWEGLWSTSRSMLSMGSCPPTIPPPLQGMYRRQCGEVPKWLQSGASWSGYQFTKLGSAASLVNGLSDLHFPSWAECFKPSRGISLLCPLA